MRLSLSVNPIGGINSSYTPSIPISLRLLQLQRHRLRASLSGAGESIMAATTTNSVRVAAAQMTSITDLASNFTTCSRLVRVFSFLPTHSLNFTSLINPIWLGGFPLFFTITIIICVLLFSSLL